jgi:hypothetical protein
METIKNVILCIDNGDVVAHGVETESGLVIGTKIGVSHKSKHELARDIQDMFNISAMEHFRLMRDNTLMLNPIEYQNLLDSCNPISWEEAEEMVKKGEL